MIMQHTFQGLMIIFMLRLIYITDQITLSFRLKIACEFDQTGLPSAFRSVQRLKKKTTNEFENEYAPVTRDRIHCCFHLIYCNTDTVLYKGTYCFNICTKYNTKCANYYSISSLYYIKLILNNANNSRHTVIYTCTAPFSLITVRN